ncbi:MAG: RidA family protein [Acidobacteriia bacterium]|nr:RidA family protein [Terriglobia bacterium]
MRTILYYIAFLLLLIPFVASGQSRRAIAPPEFEGQGSDRVPFSPGILDGNTLYVSGQIGVDLHNRKIPDEFEAEVRTCLQNIRIVLKAAGMDYGNIDFVQVYLVNMDQFTRMNAVYASMIKSPRPARVTAGVTQLAVPNAHIEISVIAHK